MIDPEALAARRGIASSYLDVHCQQVEIPASNRLNALRCMGYPLDDGAALKAMVDAEEERSCVEMLDPVQVINDDDRPVVLVRTPADLGEEAAFSYTLTLEGGEVLRGECPLYELEIASYRTVCGVEYDTRRLYLTRLPIPHGYHSLTVRVVDGERTLESTRMSLIRTPTRCYEPEFIHEGGKVWGVSVQLYALRSKTNWGIGDFHDLQRLLRGIARLGGQFVGLNPLHAGYPANPDPDMVSPYSPSSRRWLNVIYICVEDVPEFRDCRAAVDLVASNAFQQRLRALRDREYVDYRKVLELKLQVLRMAYNHQRVGDRRTLRGRSFNDFVEQGGTALLDMATYDALQASLYAQGKVAPGWQDFPSEYQNSASPFTEQWREEHLEEVMFHCYLQFIAHEQFCEGRAIAEREHMVIGAYRDLAVGVASGSCDVWGDHRQVYSRTATLGCPPDPLGPLGQSWGLCALDPRALRRSRYEPLIDLYRANMEACGALRIDHAAGLYRLWWLPGGRPASDGAYVAQPMHDLLGIIALESQRHQCLIIAEDLGTIPQELRDGLDRAGAFSYKLFFGEIAADGGYIAPQDYAPHAMAALTTHDMPTLCGWWGCADLTLGEKLGLYTAAQAKQLAADREVSKQRILDSVHGLGNATPGLPRRAAELPRMTESLAVSLQVHMCRSACRLYSAQLEDFTGVEKPVNVPGTFREYPNWRRKLTQNLEDILNDPGVIALCKAMTEARRA
ncbi:MAG: 4-alpha-glucanotransferase [Succinivibrionaceae bacterium]|nr:4-alpha-glucanotransferase [Succinivibrionaceae bacterium]